MYECCCDCQYCPYLCIFASRRDVMSDLLGKLSLSSADCDSRWTSVRYPLDVSPQSIWTLWTHEKSLALPGIKLRVSLIFVVPWIVILGRRNPNKMHLYADIYLLVNYSTCFGRPSRPSSAVRKTVVAASGTDHTIWGASFFRRDQINGRDGRPKHVE